MVAALPCRCNGRAFQTSSGDPCLQTVPMPDAGQCAHDCYACAQKPWLWAASSACFKSRAGQCSAKVAAEAAGEQAGGPHSRWRPGHPRLSK